MSQGLFLSQKMALSQVLAPQLQQSLALLQAATLELKAMVEQEMQQNPILEEVAPIENQTETHEAGEEESPTEFNDPADPPAEVAFDPATEKNGSDPVDDFQAEFDRLVQMDQDWKEHFSQTNIPLRQKEDEEEKRQYMLDSLTVGISLQESLLQQVRMSELPDTLKPTAEMIIGNIDDNGYLQSSVDELSYATNIPADQINNVVNTIQSFYPPGVGARNLRECLMLQLARVGRMETLEYTLVRDHLDALGRHRYADIAKLLEISPSEVQQAAERISHLEPHPGREFAPDDNQYIVPEIFVNKVGDEFVVTTNNEYVPHLRISNTYKDIMSQSDSPNDVKDYIRDKIRAGKFLIKSLHQRQQTILNIAREIVKRQHDFMENGVSHLKPMTMLQIAEVVGVHETTVSRAVSGKYMETPQGVYEMKYFFTSGIHTSDGVGMSNTSIKEVLLDMVKKEQPRRPLSDDQIVQVLKDKGIIIARRTVAKYRSELNILPSTLRKTY